MSEKSGSHVPFPSWLFKPTYHYGISGDIRGTKGRKITESSKHIGRAGPRGHRGIGLERALLSESDTWFLAGPGHSLVPM